MAEPVIEWRDGLDPEWEIVQYQGKDIGAVGRWGPDRPWLAVYYYDVANMIQSVAKFDDKDNAKAAMERKIISESQEVKPLRDTVSLPIPPSANQLWCSARTSDGVKVYKSKEYSQWLEVAVMLCRVGLSKQTQPIELRLNIVGGKGWRKGRDLDNSAKAAGDCLKHAGILIDDNTDYVRRIVIEYTPPVKKSDDAKLWVSIKPFVAGD